MKTMLVSLLLLGAALASAQTTTYNLSQGGASLGFYATQAAAQTAASAHGVGVYSITATTVAAPTPFIVASPNNSVLTAPTVNVIVTADGTQWGLVGGAVTINGIADASTHDVIVLALESSLIWQESTCCGTPYRWWSKSNATAAWLPASGTTTSPIPNSPPPPPPPSSGQVSRPSYNTGTGLFVYAGKIYDSNGNEFLPQGVNQLHFDSASANYAPQSGANTVRYWFDGQGYPMASHVANINKYFAAKVVLLATQSGFSNGAGTSGSSASLTDITNWFSANASTLVPLLAKHGMVNIANEWGPSNSPAWASAYVSAVAAMRAAGYLCPLVIDAGGYGQDVADLVNYAAQVENADPQKNTIFSLHIYGNIPTANVAPDLAQLRALANSSGAAFLVGEYGPGNNIGPSPTLTTPQQVWNAATGNDIGAIGWAWDDNNLAGGASNDSWFSMTLNGPGYYTGQAAQLTNWGQIEVGLLASAKKATDF